MDLNIIEMLANNRALWVTATITGIFTVIVTTINAIWLLRQRKKQLYYDKQLAEHKSRLEGSHYINRVMFDKEFEIYCELSKHLYDAFPRIELINKIKESGKEVISKEEIEINNPNLEILLNKVIGNEAFTEIQVDKLKNEASAIMLIFSRVLGESGAFIPHKIQRLFGDVYDIIYYNLSGKNGVFVDWKDVLISVGKMQSELRGYLNSLVIFDGRD